MTYQEAVESLVSTENLRARVFGGDDSSVKLARHIRLAFTRERTHVIPVGGQEPLHHAHEACWCHPLAEEGGKMLVHNAHDCREKWERNGVAGPGLSWVLIYQGGSLNQ